MAGSRRSNVLLYCFCLAVCILIYYQRFLLGLLTCILYECYRYICEIYIKNRWIHTRDGCDKLEQMYGKILDGQIYLHPDLWKVEQLNLKSQFMRATSRLTIYTFIIALLAVTQFSAESSGFELIQYVISIQVIEIIKSELNKWHSNVINQLVAKMQQRYCESNVAPARSNTAPHASNANQDMIYSILNTQAKLATNIDIFRKENLDLFIKLENSHIQLLREFQDSSHGPKLDSSLTAMHNALARLVQEIIALRTDGIAEARKDIHAINLLIKALINSRDK